MNEAPRSHDRGIFSSLLRLPAGKAGREQNPSEAENSSHSSTGSPALRRLLRQGERPWFSAKEDKLFRQMRGSITPALLVITGAFLVVIYGILFILGLQFDFSNRQVGSERALHIAEAGVNYYRWHLAHDPDDYVSGNGEHEYTDPQGAAIGKYSLEITPPSAGSSVVTIRSTGWSYQYPNIKRSIVVQYGQPSFANFSFLQHAASWYGPGITVTGPIHSNTGIRMDGTNLSLVTNYPATYVCGSETGCTSQSDCNDPSESLYCTWTPSQCICEGVWGEGGDQGLWQFPDNYIDFDSISLDYLGMSDQADDYGSYLPESTFQGYHVVLQGTSYTVYRVTNTNYYNHYLSGACPRIYERISSETLVGTYNVSTHPILFAEDHVWVEGNLDGRLTIVAARFPIDNNYMNIWIRGNLTYEDYDGSDSLGLIAQNDIYFVRDLPDDFRIDAALMAHKGKIIRHRYGSPCSSSTNAVRNSLTIYGAIISYLKSYWNYGSPPVSGFTSRDVTYDAYLLYFPPPFFPTAGEYQFISWVEE